MEGEGKGKDESMQRHTRQVMHLSPRQGNGGGMCNNINRGTAWSSRARRGNGFGFAGVAGRALKPGVWLAPVRADLRYTQYLQTPSPALPKASCCRASFARTTGRDSWPRKAILPSLPAGEPEGEIVDDEMYRLRRKDSQVQKTGSCVGRMRQR
jgi:hypothetical protein